MKTQKQIPDISFLSSNIGCDLDDAYNEIIEQKATSFLLRPLDKCANSHLGQWEGAMYISGPQRVFVVVTENYKCKVIKEENMASV